MHHRLDYIKHFDEHGNNIVKRKRKRLDDPEPVMFQAVCECGDEMTKEETRKETISHLGLHIANNSTKGR